MDYQDFISQPKSLLIAPAGYGKTYTIVECIKFCSDSERQLILTHTHAGIASLKGKFKLQNVPSTKYHIETITGFIQKYVLAFYCGKDLPQQDADNYFDMIQDKALGLFKLNAIKRIINSSYNNLFVDEYQDCSKIQHKFIMLLADVLHTHILGDPMQGIFDFRGELVNFSTDLVDFGKSYELETPWRWNDNGNNRGLGKNLKDIRSKLQSKSTIKLGNYNSIETVICNENDWYKQNSQYRNKLMNLLNENSLLIIHPTTSSIEPRLNIIRLFNSRLLLLESIDDKDSYSISKKIDNWGNKSIILLVRELSYKFFNTTGVNTWFNKSGFKKKTEADSKQKVESLQRLIEEIQSGMDYSKLSTIIKGIMCLPHIKCYRKNLVFSVCAALIIAATDNKSVYEAMISYKNTIRRVGKKIYGKCIGTTLLTKGLEFDTVAILNAHKFNNYKHFYVAITRACKKLVIFSNTYDINFN